MTKGFPVTLRNKCLVCRNMELQMMYKRKWYDSLTKKELALDHKKIDQKGYFSCYMIHVYYL